MEQITSYSPEVSEGSQDDYVVEQTEIKNIIMIGDSRAGKSTFIKYLIDINTVIIPGIFAGTVEPQSYQLSVTRDGKNMTFNFIDTPGINELDSKKSRTNEAIIDMISDFVRKDITKVHLILLTASISNGFNANSLRTIMDISKELGKSFKSNMCLLVTGYENFGLEDEKNLINKIKEEPELRVVKTACGAGTLFTGAMTNEQFSDVKTRDKFIVKQKERLQKFLRLAALLTPVSLKIKQIELANSRFQSLESIVRGLRTAVELNKDIVEMTSTGLKIRTTLSQMDIKNPDMKLEVDNIVKDAAFIGDSKEYESNFADIAQKELSEHMIKATHVQIEVEKMMNHHNRLTTIYNKMKTLEYLISMD